MSASELIEQIKALPPEEMEVVRQFVLNGASGTPSAQIRYIDPARARELGERIMSENEELFRRLAQ
ncbi:MAG TPA: hypothetical protein VF551_03380 [Chthoniobacterales bacterium]